ncbi:6979_t:CDS:1, partial [Racocetra fulgida]
EIPVQDWRMRERLKTVSGALVLCLNIGVDPPDIVKPSPCAKLECWVDPFSVPPTKALDAIGKNLQAQYEQLSIRTRYKQYLDPSVDEMKKFCTNLRKSAKEERVLLHYNGHGVPKPTASGEIWCFNKHFTQYIPVSLGDLQSWLGSPCIYVFDCSAAGNILESFKRFSEQRYLENNRPESSAPLNIQLAACGPNETLPMHPHLPADLFTSCLTSPIEIALRWFVLQNPLPSYLTVDMVMKLPGRLQDRRTPLGELNWIFTAITDTIAWNVLPRDLFKQLFRQDLMVAALFRNFLLAERIMRRYQCKPMSHPELPPTHDHPMWDSWDLAVDMCLAQLPSLLSAENGGTEVEYKHSTFFDEQLTAFQVWLSKGSVSQKPPEQLPIVLQVLLSQVHRSRALGLLSKYLDL